MAFSGDFPGPAADPSSPPAEAPEAPIVDGSAVDSWTDAPDTGTAGPDSETPGPVSAQEVSSEPVPVQPESMEPTTTAQPPAGTTSTGEPQLAAIIEIPARGASEDVDALGGGEWELLVSQLRDWLHNLKLQQTVQELRRPLTLLGWLLVLLVVLRIYGAVIGTIDRLPLVPGLLELVGVIAVGRFAATRLVRSQERQTLIRQLGERWKAFIG